jgi:exo-1,4-beta-D-glucosaminidase
MGRSRLLFVIVAIALSGPSIIVGQRSAGSLTSSPPQAPQVLELAKGWELNSAKDVSDSGSAVSRADFATSGWRPIRRMPATVLEILEEDGVYPNLYYGMNLAIEVPPDLYKQEWWYRTSFEVPAGQSVYWLDFPGINYRAEIWLNGERLADNRQVVGMYVDREFNITKFIRHDSKNVLAIKVTPEQLVPDVSGVEMADRWGDVINWRYLGYKGKDGDTEDEFVPDRNAGVWKPVLLHITGPVKLSNASVNTDLPLPATDSATLTVYVTVSNGSTEPVNGILEGTISRPGKPAIHLRQPVTLNAADTRELSLDPKQFAQLTVRNPDLWWPYTMGRPDMYSLKLKFVSDGQVSDTESIQFGIRKVTQHRDNDERFPQIGKGGNFYLQVNGKNFLVRGADYAPDLLFRYDPQAEADTIAYVKDLGLNMIRWEGKISSEHMIELADQAGIPTMLGWYCGAPWESWKSWSPEDQRVARDSLRSQILMLRSHASVFLWTNGSDGLPPEPVRSDYHRILEDLHWQNAVIDTVSSYAKDTKGNPIWDGIHMDGPYSWRPPSYWFNDKYVATQGSLAEQGDNEMVPPYSSVKKFIPPDKLWPINEYWYFHAGGAGDGVTGNDALTSKLLAVDRRYGTPESAADFSRKSQLAQYENTRAQFENFSANGWATHKMTIYWRLNDGWPSFFAGIYGYDMKPGGAYYGAKQGLQLLSIVFDYYATGNRQHAKIHVTNQTMEDRHHLRGRVRIYNVDGQIQYDRTIKTIDVNAQNTSLVLTMPRIHGVTSTYFVRCELYGKNKAKLVDNVYWQSTTDDAVGPSSNDSQFLLKQVSWANFTALSKMAVVPVEVAAQRHHSERQDHVVITLRNPTRNIAFFERAELTQGKDGPEVLPIIYSNNYVTVFPGETVSIQSTYKTTELSGKHPWLRLEGWNTKKELVEVY